jgi:hypothetical protein
LIDWPSRIAPRGSAIPKYSLRENLHHLGVLRYRKCPCLGLDAPGNFMSDAGTLCPIALCGLSSF